MPTTLTLDDTVTSCDQAAAEGLRDEKIILDLNYLWRVITGGPLANLSGIFQVANGGARAIILLEILGRKNKLTVPL